MKQDNSEIGWYYDPRTKQLKLVEKKISIIRKLILWILQIKK